MLSSISNLISGQSGINSAQLVADLVRDVDQILFVVPWQIDIAHTGSPCSQHFLSDPANHAGAEVRHVQTHGAHVFLAGPDAYKIKRAVRYDYLDFSTLPLRHDMLARELELNRPTAPEIYRDLAALKSVLIEADRTPQDRLLALEALSVPGAPFRMLALEQIALIRLSMGDREPALEQLRAILEDAESSADLRDRAASLMVALGETPDSVTGAADAQ